MEISQEFLRLKDICYLDHAGATLYSEEQIRQVMEELCKNVYGNPHSASITGRSTLDAIDQIRYRVLHHFNTDPENYSIIFTSGATAALKLVAENFDFSNDGQAAEKGVFAFSQECHTSVLGMREVVSTQCSSVIPLPQAKLKQLLDNPGKDIKRIHESKGVSNSLLVYSGQCNFSGLKNPLSWIKHCHENACRHLSKANSRWYCLLDAAALVSTSPLDLSAYKPDFVVLSFYKMMGYPTGLGALLVRNSSAHTLSNKRYFGGGTIVMALSGRREHTFRPVLHDRFEDGTLPYLSILAVRTGLETITRLMGNMTAVQRHTFALARRTYQGLKGFFHSNGKPLAKIYCDTAFNDSNTQGAIVNFNLLRPSGEYIGYSEVLHMANSHDIQLRVGCFCNLGACQRHLSLTDDDIRAHYQAGHVCGDGYDIVNGLPTGSVRISFGYMSKESDADRFLLMIRFCFLKTDSQKDRSNGRSGLVERTLHTEIQSLENDVDVVLKEQASVTLQQIVLFPIKSCGGFRPKDRWSIGPKGLNFDRVWMIVGPTGSLISQKHEPKLALVKPRIDEAANRLWLSFPGLSDCWVSLNEANDSKESLSSFCQSKVCEDRVRGQDCGQHVSDWLSQALGRPGLRLIRQLDADSRVATGEGSSIALANMAQFLLINEASVEWLADQLPPEMDCNTHGLLDRFRANLVVRGREAFDELAWSKLRIGKENFEVTGACSRCSVICVDQATGLRTKEPLRTLSESFHGRLQFGVYLSHLPCINGHAIISVNDDVLFEI